MDIPALSVALSQSETMTQVGTAVLGKIMDSNEMIAHEITALLDAAALERSVIPHIGGNIDILV